jgi:hypothetical protein
MIVLLVWLAVLIIAVAFFTNELWIWRFLMWVESKTMRLEKLYEDAEDS